MKKYRITNNNAPKELLTTSDDKSNLPLLPPPKETKPTWSHAPYIRESIIKRLPQLIKLSKNEFVYTSSNVSFDKKEIIIDYDFCLYVFASLWIEKTEMKNDTGKMPFLEDVRSELPPILQRNEARKCLMSLRGDPWVPRKGWPDDDDATHARWTAGRCRQLHRSGHIFMPESFGDNGLRSYAARLTEKGIIRAIWIHNRIPKKIAKKSSPSIDRMIMLI